MENDEVPGELIVEENPIPFDGPNPIQPPPFPELTPEQEQAKESGIQKLTAMGLTEEEARAIAGL